MVPHRRQLVKLFTLKLFYYVCILSFRKLQYVNYTIGRVYICCFIHIKLRHLQQAYIVYKNSLIDYKKQV